MCVCVYVGRYAVAQVLCFFFFSRERERKKMFGSILAAAALFGLAVGQKITLQAEDATLSGTTVGSSVAGFTGKLVLSVYNLHVDSH